MVIIGATSKWREDVCQESVCQDWLPGANQILNKKSRIEKNKIPDVFKRSRSVLVYL